MISRRRASPAPSNGVSLSSADALLMLLAIGTAAGLARALGLSVVVFLLGRYILHGVHLSWMAPLGTTLLVLALGVVVWMASAVMPALRRCPAFVAAIVWLPVWSLAMDIQGLHPVSGLLLGLGSASVAAHIARRRPAMIVRTARWVGIAGSVAVVATFLGMVAIRPMVESSRARQLPVPPAGAPNVLLVILDTVRAKSLGAHGRDTGASPTFDRLAASGVRFAHAYAPVPFTTPSHASIMTGRWPTELGSDWHYVLDARYPTLGEVLTRAGYLTAGFTANLMRTNVSTGLARGMGHYEDYSVSMWNALRGAGLVDWMGRPGRLITWIGRRSGLERKRSPEITAEFLGWLDRQPERPFFVFLNYFDAHDPYEAPPDLEATFQVPPDRRRANGTPLDWMQWDTAKADGELRAYEAAIAYQDDQLQDLFTALERRGRLHDTLVIVTSDHGEEFFEHGVMRHGNSLYRAAVHVPLVLSFPGRIPAGRVVTTPVNLRSIATTAARIVPGADGSSFEGPSLLDLMAADAGAVGEPVLSTVEAVPTQPEPFPVHHGPLFSVIDRGYRYIVDGRGLEELYALDDEDEQVNLVADPARRAVLDHLRDTLTRLRAADRPRPRP